MKTSQAGKMGRTLWALLWIAAGGAACADASPGDVGADAGAGDGGVLFVDAAADPGPLGAPDAVADAAMDTKADTKADAVAEPDTPADTGADAAPVADTSADTTSADSGAVADAATDAAPVADAAPDAAPDATPEADADADAAADVVSLPDTAVDTTPTPDAAADIAPDTSPDPAVVGCADGTREGFLHVNLYPLLAACTGAWSVPGIHHAEGPACGREAGNDGLNAQGQGCNVEDLCAAGWHVCLGKTDVLLRNDTGCDGIMAGAVSPAFFLARTSSTGAFNCAPDAIGEPVSENDLFGCGDLGCKATVDTCAPLTQASHDLCKTLKNMPGCGCTWNADGTDVKCSPSSGGCGWCKPLDYWNLYTGVTHPDAWDCGTDGNNEALNVVKSHPDQQGGVLCCQDFE